VPALGFVGLGAQYYKDSALTATLATADELDDRVDSLTRGFLGFTVSCARCHDHKFDPIPQLDYYSLVGVFSSCKLADIPLVSKAEQEKFKAQEDRIKKIQTEMQTFVKAEKQKLAEGRVGDVSKYLVAAWQYRLKKAESPKLLAKDYALSIKFDLAALERGVRLLEASPTDPALASVIKLGAADLAKVEEATRAFEKLARASLAERDPKKPLDKAKAEVLRKLFGEAGVFDPNDADLKAKLPAEPAKNLERLKTDIAALQKDIKPLPAVHAVAEAKIADAKVNIRGNPLNLGEAAPRRFLRILSSDNPPAFSQGSGRLELAEAIASPTNPLTARVFVNRVWMYHFGRGLVGTPSNFGHMGERPSHPELLDDLASRFMESGWSVKALHKEIMLSATYQMSSDVDAKSFAQDGDNRLYWRMNRRRLDVEAWRDAMLAVSGKLDPTFGGPTVSLAQDSPRRTVYAKISRHNLDALLRLFDFPDANITSERRTETTVPQQQLFVMNSPFVANMAKGLASRMKDAKGDDAAKIERGYRLAFSRGADPEEIRDALAYLAASDDTAEQKSNTLTRWDRLAQVMLGSNEFLYID